MNTMRDHVKTLFGGILLSCLAAGLLPPPVVSVAVGQVPSGQDGRIVSFKQSADKIEAYDFVEVTASVAKPIARNPFTDVALKGQFQGEVPGQFPSRVFVTRPTAASTGFASCHPNRARIPTR